MMHAILLRSLGLSATSQNLFVYISFDIYEAEKKTKKDVQMSSDKIHFKTLSSINHTLVDSLTLDFVVANIKFALHIGRYIT